MNVSYNKFIKYLNYSTLIYLQIEQKNRIKYRTKLSSKHVSSMFFEHRLFGCQILQLFF